MTLWVWTSLNRIVFFADVPVAVNSTTSITRNLFEKVGEVLCYNRNRVVI
ncbi:hypothetical protein PAECIP111892_05050 [Paenibacillus auburnensis]|uniref:Uncharacterized protein n=1 Tax=Paenibacillus auburnensis TaxID=2905649 RepID=A0ABM9CTH4_9BACL|nr:hypothetical protein PAECIP111892_05050 [Paenibacillus auburnensis]